MSLPQKIKLFEFNRHVTSDAIHPQNAGASPKKSEKSEKSKKSSDSTSATAVETAPCPEQPLFKPTLRFYLAFVAISSLTLAAAVDATSLSIALPIMTKELGGSAIEAFWAGTSFLIASAIVMPVYAALSHIFGRKSLMHLGAILFTAGSILGALAPNMLVMLVGRAIQGIGAGGVVVLGEIIITDLVPLNERGKWLGWLGSMWTIGGVIGPLTGGVFAQFATWRWVFWILIPFIIFGSIMLQFFLKQEPVAGHAFHKLLRVDWFGTVLFLVSTTAILVPLTCGGILAPWQDWRILVPILLGIDVLVIFIYWEKRHATEPMLRLTIFSNWTLRSTYIQTVLHAMIFWAMFYYLPLYYQVIKTYTPFQTGLAMLPQTLIVSPTTILIGLLISKTLRYRWSLYSGWLLTVLGTGLLILLDRATSPAVWIPINIVACLGIGALIVGMNFCVQAAVPAPDCGHAVAFYVFLRQFGEGLGVAVGGVIFQNRLRANLAASVYWQDRADEYARRATTLGEVMGGMQEGGRRDELVMAYVGALKMVWVAMCVVAVVGMAATGLVRGFGMQQRLQTEQGFIGDRRGGAGESGEAGSTV